MRLTVVVVSSHTKKSSYFSAFDNDTLFVSIISYFTGKHTTITATTIIKIVIVMIIMANISMKSVSLSLQ